jgi:uncharacterized SAM-binding protein YcdF (DUF218 family)
MRAAATATLAEMLTERMQRAWRLFRNAAAALGLLMLLVTTTPLLRWYAQWLAGPWYEPQGDILILLGADTPSDGIIGPVTYWRSFYAVLAWREGGFRTIVVSGGEGIAESIRDFLVYEKVPADKIVIENRSVSTHENAIFTAAIVRGMPGRKVLLTSDFHVYRSVRAFDKAGVEVTPRPIPYALKRSNLWTERWPVFLEMAMETAKILDYRIRGWI